jgi:hypothetical protein
VKPGASLCPNCGEDTRALWQVGGQVEEPGALFGKRRRQDRIEMGLGFFTALGLSCLIPIGFIGCGVSIVLGFFALKRHPAFSKGMFFGTAAGVLGAIYICSRVILPHLE